MFVPLRVDTEEMLDAVDAPRRETLRSLRDLRRFNRWMGGIAVYRRLLRAFGNPPPETILDLGTGTSDLLASLRDGPIRRIGLDVKLEHLLYGRELGGAAVDRIVGDALHLPFRDGSVDLITSAHFFHHFTPEQNVSLLDESLRVSKRGVVVNDTRRHLVPLLVVRLLGMLRLVGTITRFDAPASVLRGFTTQEASDIARRTVASRSKVIRLWPYRFGLLLWK
ncbi:MAG TPA: methyltransferase domain-containing protein [Thermoanaerobaculia bacterium]|nr:methyltransferase domain-containing protein [Thermoanaerobaculia bacterium]